MDLEIQEAIRDAVREYDRDQLVVFLGVIQPERIALSVQTVTTGDPAYAGPLAGVSLRLPVFHILEGIVKRAVAPEVWRINVELVETAINASRLLTEFNEVRESMALSGSELEH